MKWEWNNRLVSRIIGISLSVSVIMSVMIASQISAIKQSVAVNSHISTRVSQPTESVVIPFDDIPEYDLGREDSEKLYKVYKELVKAEKKQTKPAEAASDETAGSTTEVTAASTTSEQTTVTTTAVTTASSQVTQTTGTEAEPTVSNGKEPFCYSDVSSIASHLNTLGDFVEKLHPTSYRWDTSEYEKKGCISVSLTSEDGSVTLDVKPLHAKNVPYTIDGKTSGAENTVSVTDWDWFAENKEAGCNIASICWKSSRFAIAPVRSLGVGSSLADVTDSYLCVNGGATTLYKASDVIREQSKLNTLLSAENVYTFVGGRFYTMGSYLDKYYSSTPHAYPFSDCEYVVQYGCNSIMEHDYATGSWILEYAIRDNAVAGILFLNKSYCKSETKTAVSTETSQSNAAGSSQTTAPTQEQQDVESAESQETQSSETSASLSTSSSADPAKTASSKNGFSKTASSQTVSSEVRSEETAPESVEGESVSTTAAAGSSDTEESDQPS